MINAGKFTYFHMPLRDMTETDYRNRITVSGQAPPILPIREKVFHDNILAERAFNGQASTMRTKIVSGLIEDCA